MTACSAVNISEQSLCDNLLYSTTNQLSGPLLIIINEVLCHKSNFTENMTELVPLNVFKKHIIATITALFCVANELTHTSRLILH